MYYFLGFMTQPEISIKKLVKLEQSASSIREVDCKQPDKKFELLWNPNKTYSETVLSDLKFNFDLLSYGPGQRIETPFVGIKLDDGWLLGSNRGEWGGRLVYKKNDKVIKIIDDNIEDVYSFDFGYIVTAGLAHMSLDRGSVYLVNQIHDGEFKVKKIHVLTSSPRSSWLLNDKELLVNLARHKAALINSTGDLEFVNCQN
jgi:hypothetical protein